MIDLSSIEQALDIVPVPLLLAADDGTILTVNPEVEALFGYSSGKLVGQSLDVLVPPAIREQHRAHVAAFLDALDRRSLGDGPEMVGIRKTGEEIALQLGLNTVEVDGRRCTVLSAVDISAPVRQRQSGDAPADTMEAAMLLVDATGTIAHVNEAALRLTGYRRADLLGQPIEKLIPARMRLRHVALRDSYVRSGAEKEMSPGRKIHLLDRDGEAVPVQVSLTPVERPEGRGVMCAVVDLRRQIASERRIAQQNRELVTRNRELTQFAYSISHDLKAPLSSLQGLMSLMREDIDTGNTESLRNDIDQALDICRRSRLKVERVLDLARDQRDGSIGPVQVRALIDTIWNSLLPGADVDARLDLDLLIEEIETSETGLEVILHNLLSNALAYHDPGKERLIVHVGTALSDGAFVLRVGDNGIGISEEHRDRIFELFQKLDKRAGDGIGLALVLRHVSRLGGDIDVQSKPGQGTTFSVRLPVAA